MRGTSVLEYGTSVSLYWASANGECGTGRNNCGTVCCVLMLSEDNLRLKNDRTLDGLSWARGRKDLGLQIVGSSRSMNRRRRRRMRNNGGASK